MSEIIEGKLDATGLRFGIVISRFNSFICERLLEGAVDALVRHGAEDAAIQVIRVPGAFEMPLIAQKIAKSGRHDAVICLGAIIRGSTPHFDFVSAEVTRGIATASMETGIPISFGVLTTDTIEQAIERAGTKSGNKGFDAAMSALEMANICKNLKSM